MMDDITPLRVAAVWGGFGLGGALLAGLLLAALIDYRVL